MGGQGTIEYLVIIGIVVVIALVVVFLATEALNNSGSGVSTISSKIASVSSIFALLSTSVSPDGNYLLRIQNNLPETITTTKIYVGDASASFSTSMPQGSTQNFIIPSGQLCNVGEKKSLTVKILYTSQAGLSKSHTFNSNITFNCENYTIIGLTTTQNTNPSQENTPPIIHLSYPTNNSTLTSNTIDFNYTFTDTDLTQCNLYLDGNSTALDTNQGTLTPNTQNKITTTITNLTEGIHTWDINCTDTEGLTASDINGWMQTSFTYQIPAYCGDGIINLSETCDGSVPVGTTCTTVNNDYIGGTLSCNPSGSLNECDFNITHCVTDTNLALFYKFDGNITDYSGNNRSSSICWGTPNYESISGKINQAINSATVCVTGANNPNLDGNFTITAWVYPTGVPQSEQEILCKGSSLRFFVRGNNGENNYKLAATCGSSWMSFSDIALTPNTWSHIALVFVRNSGLNLASFYINGVPKGQSSTAEACTTGSTDSWFGNNSFYLAGSYPFNGAFDNLMVWTRPLTENEIVDLNNSPY